MSATIPSLETENSRFLNERLETVDPGAVTPPPGWHYVHGPDSPLIEKDDQEKRRLLYCPACFYKIHPDAGYAKHLRLHKPEDFGL